MKGRVVTVFFTMIGVAAALAPIAEAGRWGG
jgi:hypothetical protein